MSLLRITSLPLALAWIVVSPLAAEPPAATRTPLVRTVDLDVGERQEVVLCDGSRATVQLLDLDEQRDSVRQAVRRAVATVDVNGQRIELVAAMYHLPATIAGVRIDCAVTKGYTEDSSKRTSGDWSRTPRLRLWPAGSPWIEPGTFSYPAKAKWFASDTQMANEPVFVDGGEVPGRRATYYHYGLDFGGVEGMVDVVAATDGLVVSAAGKTLPGYEDSPAKPRYDVVYLVDDRGWYYRYSHMQTIEPASCPGQESRGGRRSALLGKEGGSGGWSHLHFDITAATAVRPVGHTGGLRIRLGGLPAGVSTPDRRRGPPAPTGLDRRAGNARRQQVVECGRRRPPLPLDVQRRHPGRRTDRSETPTHKRAATAKS